MELNYFIHIHARVKCINTLNMTFKILREATNNILVCAGFIDGEYIINHITRKSQDVEY